MTTRELLINARALIAHPRNWCKRTERRKSLLGMTDQFCSIGAIKVVGPDPIYSDAAIKAADPSVTIYSDALHLLDIAAWCLGYSSAIQLNDDPYTTHELVLEMFDKAIASLPEPEAGLAEPSIPLVVPAPDQEPRETPVYPTPTPEPLPEPEPTPATPTPEREPVPA